MQRQQEKVVHDALVVVVGLVVGLKVGAIAVCVVAAAILESIFAHIGCDRARGCRIELVAVIRIVVVAIRAAATAASAESRIVAPVAWVGIVDGSCVR